MDRLHFLTEIILSLTLVYSLAGLFVKLVFKLEKLDLLLGDIKHKLYTAVGLEDAENVQLVLILYEEVGSDNVCKQGGVFDRLECGNDVLCGGRKQLCHLACRLCKTTYVRLILNAGGVGQGNRLADDVCGVVLAGLTIRGNDGSGHTLCDTADSLFACVYKLLDLNYRAHLKKLGLGTALVLGLDGNSNGVF